MFQIAKKVSRGALNKTQAVRSISSNCITDQGTLPEKKRKGMLDVWNRSWGKLGAVHMNREHRYNMLTPSMIKDIHRGVESVNIDHEQDVIYMAPYKGQHFSIGTDFRTIAHMKKEGNYDAIVEYMQQIVNLQTYFAKLNKPLVVVAPGVALNSGAALLAATSMPYAVDTLKFAFNEVNYGFVPHSGATFYMSRMPGEFGTFMALTGLSITGSDTAVIGNISTGMVGNPVGYDEEVAYALEVMDSQTTVNSRHAQTKIGRNKEEGLSPWQHYLKTKEVYSERAYQPELRKLFNRDQDKLEHEKFLEPEDRVNSSVAEAEFKYMTMLRKDAKKDEDSLGYFEWGKFGAPGSKFTYRNHFLNCIAPLENYIGQTYDQNAATSVKQQQLIDRCFWSNSVEEIRENLKKETHPFAKKCLDAMDMNSPLSMAIALKMMRKAQNLCYKGCLRMEVEVGMNKIKDKDFDIGVRNVLQKPRNSTPGGLGLQKSPFNQTVKESEIDKYFEPSAHSKSIDVDVVEHALLPTKMYYERFSDQVRLWINEESTTQPHIRDTYQTEAQEALREHGIDVRDKALTIENARNHLAGKLANERRDKILGDRMENVMTDRTLRKSHSLKVQKVLEDLEKDTDKFELKVKDYTDKVFENAFHERLDTMYSKSFEANNMIKRSMFIRLKKFMFKSRILTYVQKEADRLGKEMKNIPYKLPHLVENWDQSWREIDHPDIKKSPLYYISKAIGRVNLAPAELAQAYLTQPEMREKMQMVTFDEQELKKLQADLLADPIKYFEIFTGKPDMTADDFLGAEHYSLDIRTNVERERHLHKLVDTEEWHRVIQDERCPRDALPWVMHEEAYKHWVSEIQYKAVDNLKMTISQLLMEIDQSKHRTSKKFKGQDRESTRDALVRLLDLANKSEYLKKAQKKPKAKKRGRKNEEFSIDKLLSEVLASDKSLGNIFDESKYKDNQRINSIREQARREFNQLLELVLLEKYGSEKASEEEKERQAEVFKLLADFNSKSHEKELHLSLIDGYLAHENGKAVLEDAVEILKPFFLEMMARKVSDEQNRVLDQEFGAEELLDRDVAWHFYFSKAFPEIDRSRTRRHWETFSEKRLSFEAADGNFHWNSLHQQRKELVEEVGDLELVSEKLMTKTDEEKRTQSIKQGLARIDEFDEEVKKIYEDFDKTNEKLRMDDMMSLIDESKENPLLNEAHMSQFVRNEGYMWNRMGGYIDTMLEKYKYELDHVLSKEEWLNIYADAILDEGLDMNYLKKFHKIEHQTRRMRNDKITNLVYNDADYEYTREPNDWQALAEYTRFLADFGTAIDQNKMGEHDINLQKFIAKINHEANAGDQLRSQSIFNRSIQQINDTKNNNSFYDRHKDLKESLTSLKRTTLKGLKERHHETKQLRFELNELLDKNDIQDDFIRNAVNHGSKYVDLNQLKEKLISQTEGKDRTSGSSLNVAMFVRDLKYHTDSHEEIMNSKIDVISLANLKSATSAEIREVLNHVDQQTQYMANDMRQQITLKEFFDDHHFSSALSYRTIADNALKNRLENHFGKSKNAAEVPDWQFASARTHPADHFDKKTQNEKVTKKLLDQAQEERAYEANTDEYAMAGNPDIGATRFDTQSNLDLKEVLTDAKKMTELPFDMESLKNLTQNKLIVLQREENFEKEEISKLIKEYMKLRMNSCYLNPEFVKKSNGKNGQVYLDQLKENVIDELDMSRPALTYDLSSHNLQGDGNEHRKYDLDAAYNLLHLNNENAMGYSKLTERAQAQSSEENANIAQETALDKLLANYFLTTRGAYKDSNQMFQDITGVFQDKTMKTHTERSLDMIRQKQLVNKEEEPLLNAEHFRSFMDLDSNIARTLQKNKNGLSEDLRKIDISDKEDPNHYLTQIPEFFDQADVRKPADLIVDDELKGIIIECFQYRQKLEVEMTRNELVAFDKTLARYLKPENLIKKLRYEVEKQFNELDFGGGMIQNAEIRKDDLNNFAKKEQDMNQRDFNKLVQNENAQYQSIIFDYMDAEKQNAAKTDLEKLEQSFSLTEDSFQEFYSKQLQQDAKKAARTINPEDFKPKKYYDVEPKSPYLNEFARVEEFEHENKLFRQGKLEKSNRQQLFYILEQFHQTSLNKPNAASEAQQHLEEYFDDADNTYFFDKNKIK